MAKKKQKEMTLPELRQLLREKKDNDKGFAKLMEEQPNLALEKCLGEKIPENIKVHFLEDTLDTLYVVLPANPEELSDEMLGLVSGGGFFDFFKRKLGLSRKVPEFDVEGERIGTRTIKRGGRLGKLKRF